MLARLLAALSLATSAVAAAQSCPTRPSWPTTDWPMNLNPSTASAEEIKALEDYAFTLTGKPEDREGLRTNALLIVKGGAIIYEKYARGFTAQNRHISWSVAKSISTMLVGVARHKGLVDLEASICDYLTRFRGDPEACAIKVKDIITHASGLQWQEAYEYAPRESNSVAAMIYGMGHRDQVAFVLGHRRRVDPGTQFVYSTGDAHVVAAVAKAALATVGPDAFWTELFNKIGAPGVSFLEDAAGNPLGGSFVFATPRDFARIGFLALNDGCWAGERILAQGWMTASTTPSPAFQNDRGVCPAPASPPADEFVAPCEDTPNGYMWWLNVPPRSGLERPWPDAPADTFSANGHWGQFIHVIPSEDMVIVRTGDDRTSGWDINQAIKLAIPLTR